MNYSSKIIAWKQLRKNFSFNLFNLPIRCYRYLCKHHLARLLHPLLLSKLLSRLAHNNQRSKLLYLYFLDVFSICLWKHSWRSRSRAFLSDESRGRREIYMYLAAPFDNSRIDRGAKISIKSSFMETIFFIFTFDRSDVPGENSSVRSKLPTLACWSGRKVGKVPSKPYSFALATSVPPRLLFKVNNSLPVEELNLIVVSKSLSVKVNI